MWQTCFGTLEKLLPLKMIFFFISKVFDRVSNILGGSLWSFCTYIDDKIHYSNSLFTVKFINSLCIASYLTNSSCSVFTAGLPAPFCSCFQCVKQKEQNGILLVNFEMVSVSKFSFGSPAVYFFQALILQEIKISEIINFGKKKMRGWFTRLKHTLICL